LFDQLAETFSSHVKQIYSEVNANLAKNGIAAQLQKKIKKSPVVPSLEQSMSAQLGPDTLPPTSPEYQSQAHTEQAQVPVDTQSAPTLGHSKQANQASQFPDTPKSRMERLFESVRGFPHRAR